MGANWPSATVISQYGDSPTLTQILDNLATYLDPTVNLQDFYSNFWNLDTAVGPGLDAWGRRVGVNRVVTVSGGDYLGFSAPGGSQSSGDSFNVGIFYSGEQLTSNFALTDNTFRQLILAKAASNITNGSIPAFNAILMNLFPNRGNIYVQDNQNMTAQIISNFHLQPFEVAILTTSNVLPFTCGVLFPSPVYP